MKPDEIIENYVSDVALKLPRAQRDDVAFELRALLHEELQAKADAAGRSADAAMTMALLEAFGHPKDVAARYRPTLTIIDPADGHAFRRATLIGLAVIWCAGLLKVLQQPIGSGWDLLTPLSQWWLGTVIPSLWWPGLLVVGFAMAARARRRRPHAAVWTPRAGKPTHANRIAMAAGIVGIVCGVSVLIEPRWVLDVVWQGRAAPVAYEALTYAEPFRHRQAPILLGLLLLNIPMLIAVMLGGRWSVNIRRMETALSLITCGVMLWTVLDGPVFMADSSDSTVKFVMAVIVAITLINLGVQAFRRVRPRPDRGVQTQL
jgi:hypothetical protein